MVYHEDTCCQGYSVDFCVGVTHSFASFPIHFSPMEASLYLCGKMHAATMWLLLFGHNNSPSYRFTFPICATDRYRTHCFRTLRSTSSYPKSKLTSLWVSEAIFCAIKRESTRCQTHKVLRLQNFTLFQRQAGELQESSTRSGSYWSMGHFLADPLECSASCSIILVALLTYHYKGTLRYVPGLYRGRGQRGQSVYLSSGLSTAL